MSIRLRLTVGVVLLLLVAFGALGAVIVGTTRVTLVEQVDARVLAATERLGPPGRRGNDGGRDGDDHGPQPGDEWAPGSKDTAYGGNGSPGMLGRDGVAGFGATPPAGGGSGAAGNDPYERPIAHLVFAPDGTLLDADPSGYPDAPDPLPVLPAASSLDGTMGKRIVTLRSADGELAYRALVDRRPDATIDVTAAPLSSVDDAVAHIVRAVASAAAAALALAALASWWLIRGGLRPVDRMVDTAAAIAGGDLGRRVPDADPRTELGRLGAALNEMLGQIERSAAARAASEERLRRFVADAAHELRTPLTSLRGYAELYRQGALPTPEAVAKAMGRIESEAARMGRLVEDLLLLARLDRQRALEREPVDLAVLAREATADFAAVEPERPFEHRLEDGVVVLGDRARLRQVVDNLLANARTHTPAGTPVRLSVRRAGGEAELVVADEGPGIPPEARERVFERFWRADPGRARARGGSGLGLAIVASLVAAHDGTVSVADGSAPGARFVVRLPLAEPVA